MLKRALAAGFVLAITVAGSASALKIDFGNIAMEIDGGFTPQVLPANRDAPISLHGYARIWTKDGSHPPVLETLVIEYDRHGHVQTRGLPRCTVGHLENTDVQTARRNCPGAIVGTGSGRAIIEFPDSRPIPASSPLTIFNGPRFRGDPTVIAHAYLTVPVPTTFTVPVRIETIRKGRYGYRTEAAIPKIAGGYGSPVYGRIKVHRRWRNRGRNLSYVNARCSGGRLQARAFFDFNNGDRLQGTVLKRCRVRRR